MFTRQQRRTKGQMVGRSAIGMARRAADDARRDQISSHSAKRITRQVADGRASVPSSALCEDPPRIEVACQKCGNPSHQLFVSGPGLICATCKAKEKGNQ